MRGISAPLYGLREIYRGPQGTPLIWEPCIARHQHVIRNPLEARQCRNPPNFTVHHAEHATWLQAFGA
eukprot:3635623-Alexandrium_andersonii.AAC.1